MRLADREKQVFKSLPGERWRPIPSLPPGYEASNLGRIRSFRIPGRSRRLSTVPQLRVPVDSPDGYYRMMFLIAGKRVSRCVHLLVAEAFHGSRPRELQCRHLDGNSKNNRCRNLKYGTRKQNIDDMIRHGRNRPGEENINCKLTNSQVFRIRASREKGVDLAAKFCVSPALICKIRRLKIWRHLAE